MRTAILITARMKSTRLPRKVTLPIQGRPLLSHIIERLRWAKLPDEIVICTSPLADDDEITVLAEEESIPCFRGDPDDVLQRLTDAADEYGAERIFNCTADNPFVDPIYLDRLLQFLSDNAYDYAETEGLPRGTYGWALSVPAMRLACEMKAERNTEVWGGYFTQTGRFSWGTLKAAPGDYRPNLRLTLDTPDDLKVVTAVFDALHTASALFSLQDIFRYCDAHPDISGLNAHITQQQPIPIKIKGDTSEYDPRAG